ncbi:heterokaryon incompatibility protein-domain-containing protein [Truncatella angustata]|uniref:Heterokaryon incompatibility protein-domain-containing protein n=1 Tax=Truncatella angustata TaxID=152316 RepID=A0A9P8UT76_9PEZI|nr:heterokaryon incompatibility protein-domain-containing protein [Truncatella angustata]KAH6657652.1 heterokaryon incompatibility protein-domain-containing protein [Truncatella angustata]
MNRGNEALCGRCTALNFQSLFSRLWISGETTSYDIGSIHEVFEEDACGFCTLVRHTYQTFFGADALAKVLGWVTERDPRVLMTPNPLDLSYDILRTSTAETALYVDFSFWDPPVGLLEALESERFQVRGDEGAGFLPQIIALRDSNPNTDRPIRHFGQVVDPGEINWGMVREWLKTCASLHYGSQICQNPTTRGTTKGTGNHMSPLTLRAIDVDQACVVTLPNDAPYIALSYVWGKDQHIKLKRDNITSVETPSYFLAGENAPSKTIVDAMQASRYLGYRYLWVDALCIVQDDAQNIRANVESMQQIYSGAALTMVAAAGHDADFGIPGVSGQCLRTKQQRHLTLNEVTISNRLESTLNITHWNTRGWTFQERILSARLLNFTTAQVSFQCDRGCNCEEQFHSSLDNTGLFIQYDHNTQLDFETYDIFEVYALAVNAYTDRYLTDPMDKVRAFDGILHVLKEPFEGSFFYGLPVTMFDAALLWIPVKRCMRGSKKFPSWSWAGWTGQVCYDYDKTNHLTNLLECTACRCTITLAPSDTKLCLPVVPATDEFMPNGWTRHFDEDENEITYLKSKASSSLYKYPRPLRDPPKPDLSKNSFDLTISGQVATFRLTGQHSGRDSFSSSCDRGLHYRCELAVLDDEHRPAGMVVVDSYLVPQLQDLDHRFLAISRSTISRQNEDITWDADARRFRSWMDETIGEREASNDATYEPYTEHFQDWIAEMPENPDPSLPLTSDPVKPLDRSSTFKRDKATEFNRHAFDNRYYSEMVPWPVMNVLLLSKKDNGVMERVGVGRIHVDAFTKKAVEATVLLG